MESPLFLVRQLLLALSLLLTVSSAFAHEGHDHGDSGSDAAAPLTVPRLTHSSDRMEAVALLDHDGVLVYVDDYASNAPLPGLAVRVRGSSGVLNAQESEPGLYRVPLDLLPQDDPVALDITVAGAGWSEQFKGSLPRPAAAASSRASARLWWGGALGLAILAAGAVVLTRRRGATVARG